MKKILLLTTLFLIALHLQAQSELGKQISIIKTNNVFVASNESEVPVESELEIYWIIDLNRNEIKVIRSKGLQIIKLIKSNRENYSGCGYNSFKYISEHPEMAGLILEFFISISDNEICFVRLFPKEGSGNIYYLSMKKELIESWISCNTL